MISKSNVKFTDSEVRTWLVDSLHRPSKKLRNCLKIKIRKILKDQQKWRRSCSTKTLREKQPGATRQKRISASVEIFLCESAIFSDGEIFSTVEARFFRMAKKQWSRLVLSASAFGLDYSTSTLIIPDITKTSSNNCLLLVNQFSCLD